MRSMRTLLAASAVVLLVACGGESSPADSASALDSLTPTPAAAAGDPCAILTREEMSAAAGAPITAVESAGSTRCVYRTDNALVYVDLEVDRENADASWRGVNDGNATIEARQDTVEGLGASAFYGPRDRLYLRTGSAYVAIEGGFDGEARARARRVAEAVLPKLR